MCNKVNDRSVMCMCWQSGVIQQTDQSAARSPPPAVMSSEGDIYTCAVKWWTSCDPLTSQFVPSGPFPWQPRPPVFQKRESGGVQDSELRLEILSMDCSSWETKWSVSASPNSWLKTDRQTERQAGRQTDRLQFRGWKMSHVSSLTSENICQTTKLQSLYVSDMKLPDFGATWWSNQTHPRTLTWLKTQTV